MHTHSDEPSFYAKCVGPHRIQSAQPTGIQEVLLTLVVLATAEFPEGIKAAIPKGLQVKTVSQGVPFAHAVQG